MYKEMPGDVSVPTAVDIKIVQVNNCGESGTVHWYWRSRGGVESFCFDSFIAAFIDAQYSIDAYLKEF